MKRGPSKEVAGGEEYENPSQNRDLFQESGDKVVDGARLANKNDIAFREHADSLVPRDRRSCTQRFRCIAVKPRQSSENHICCQNLVVFTS